MPQTPRDKSLFASFSSEKEDSSWPLLLDFALMGQGPCIEELRKSTTKVELFRAAEIAMDQFQLNAAQLKHGQKIIGWRRSHEKYI